GRGRAALRRRYDDEGGAHRRPRFSGATHRSLRPAQPRRGVPPYRAQRRGRRAGPCQGAAMIAAALIELWADFHLSDSLRRVGAMLLRHLYLMRSSWTRVFDLMYWPVLQLLIWGFLTTYLATSSSALMRAGGLLIGAALLWDVLVRGQFGMTLSLLEEMWARNFANLFVTPLRPTEFAVALMGMSILRSLIGVLPASIVAIPLFHYSVYSLG